MRAVQQIIDNAADDITRQRARNRTHVEHFAQQHERSVVGADGDDADPEKGGELPEKLHALGLDAPARLVTRENWPQPDRCAFPQAWPLVAKRGANRGQLCTATPSQAHDSRLVAGEHFGPGRLPLEAPQGLCPHGFS